jgi:hypothetical protein
MLSPDTIKRGKIIYKRMLRDDVSCADRLEKSARLVAHKLKIDERSWQVVKVHIILPVLVDRGLREPTVRK